MDILLGYLVDPLGTPIIDGHGAFVVLGEVAVAQFLSELEPHVIDF